jgi:hypothetical protein
MPDQRYDADRRTLGVLLSATSPRIQVPDWQRSYSWGSEQLDQFWTDLTTFDSQYPGTNIDNQEYFLGSIVLVTGGPTLLLLDGQQRLATTTILLSALRDARRGYKADAAARLQAKYIKDFDDATGSAEYILTLNEYDRDFFRRRIQDEEVTRMEPTLRSHALIVRARDYFNTRIAEAYRTRGGGESAFNWNLRISRVLTDHMSVVAVTSSDEDNAAAVFETLNDRGIGLSTPDLLRSYLLRKALDASSRERMVSAWQQILVLNDDGINVDQFLRHYWVSLRGDVKARSLYREMKLRIDGERIDALRITEDLARSAQIYRDLAKAAIGPEPLKECLESLSELAASVAYPLLLAAVDVADENDEHVARLARTLVCLFVRYNVVGGRETTVLEGAVYATAKDLRDTKDFDAISAKLRDLAPGLREFKRQFEHASVSRPATQRYLLKAIEAQMRLTEEMDVASPSRVHVEHIYPQRPPQTARLLRHAALINRMGNLTLLSRRLNQQIRNSDFTTKKERAYGTSEILMTRTLTELGDVWDANAIDERQRRLASYAVAVWRFPAEPEFRESDSAATDEIGDDSETLDPDSLPETPEGNDGGIED